MALQVALADFQIVHPTETEIFKDVRPTGMFDEHGRQVLHDHGGTRRKRLPLEGGKVIVKGVRVLAAKEPVEMAFDVDKSGRAICAVTQDQLPQAPMDVEFEFYGPKGLIERGKVRCGGNEAVRTREVVLQNV